MQNNLVQISTSKKLDQREINQCEWSKILGSAESISVNWPRLVGNTEFNIANFRIFLRKNQ